MNDKKIRKEILITCEKIEDLLEEHLEFLAIAGICLLLVSILELKK